LSNGFPPFILRFMAQSDLFSFVSASKKFHPCKTARKKKPSRALFFFFFSL